MQLPMVLPKESFESKFAVLSLLMYSSIYLITYLSICLYLDPLTCAKKKGTTRAIKEQLPLLAKKKINVITNHDGIHVYV